ncbi:hypothetical protein AAZX31_20G215400 [Glycine max]|uniref:Uncharacterized protein n=1 Tax=Glycine max TaxID=3847 RepID=K7N557_SOYBN|nr:uncharacterized protein LOC102669467 [Glycine max]KAG4919789.1 hypothetical protein JHK85_058070 [Glycine max]KAH1192071.1 hypothetical protein GmHk_20G059158 [Glycine max]KRG92775.1 hypothetical protein GLYMA_20G229300v4 [Glycine max]|eukprot:XP_006606939.1 uncharacterized protein LOC102669467 [Glycine max]
MREVGAVDGGVSVTEVDLLGRQVISEYVGGQVVHKLEEKERKVNKLVEGFFHINTKRLATLSCSRHGWRWWKRDHHRRSTRGHRFDPFTFFHPMNAKSPGVTAPYLQGPFSINKLHFPFLLIHF